MGAVKRKSTPGKNHPLAWNPLFLWQLLRRSKSYRRAVDECHLESRGAFDHICDGLKSTDLPWPSFSENVFPLENSSKAWDQIRKGFQQEKFEPSNIDAAFLVYGNREHFKHVGIEKAVNQVGHHLYALSAEDPNLRKFLSRFGDVIRFPIPYQIENPNPVLFKVFWNLRPASVISKAHLDSVYRERSDLNYKSIFYRSEINEYELGLGAPYFQEQDADDHVLLRLAHLHLEINTHFNKEAILEQATQILSKAIDVIIAKHPPGKLLDRQPNLERLENEKRLRAAELYEDELSEQEIGSAIYPKDSPEVLAGLDKKMEDGKTIEEIQKSLGTSIKRSIQPYMDFFNRS